MKNEYKIIFVGESGVGAKTSLINRITHNDFKFNTMCTTGASRCGSKTFELKNGKKILI